VANPVNSGEGKNADQFAVAVTNRQWRIVAGNLLEKTIFCSSLGHARFLFLVKKIFSRPKNKIHFFLVDSKTGF